MRRTPGHHALGITHIDMPATPGRVCHDRLKDAAAAEAALHTRSEAFRQVNPNGYIPGIDGGGLELHESLATDLYLARKHGGVAVGGRFTTADINLAEVRSYAPPAADLFDAAPGVKAWLAACQARPAFRRMWQERGREPA